MQGTINSAKFNSHTYILGTIEKVVTSLGSKTLKYFESGQGMCRGNCKKAKNKSPKNPGFKDFFKNGLLCRTF